jgi:hypothetical protein
MVEHHSVLPAGLNSNKIRLSRAKRPSLFFIRRISDEEKKVL